MTKMATMPIYINIIVKNLQNQWFYFCHSPKKNIASFGIWLSQIGILIGPLEADSRSD